MFSLLTRPDDHLVPPALVHCGREVHAHGDAAPARHRVHVALDDVLQRLLHLVVGPAESDDFGVRLAACELGDAVGVKARAGNDVFAADGLVWAFLARLEARDFNHGGAAGCIPLQLEVLRAECEHVHVSCLRVFRPNCIVMWIIQIRTVFTPLF